LLGRENVAYIVSDEHKGKRLENIEIISFDELKEIHFAFRVVIADVSQGALYAQRLSSLKIPYAPLYGGMEFFSLWQNIYRLSLWGMNLGLGSDYASSGEEAVLTLMTQKFNLPKRPILFDVGANHGNYTLLLSKHFPKADIHLFEPGKTTFEICKKNVTKHLSSVKNIRFNNFGMSDKAGESTLYYDNPGSGLASVYKRELDYLNIDYSKSESITLKTIDEYCAENNIDNIDFLKMDVEGNELNVLKGAKNMLEGGNISNIQIEFGGCNLDSRTIFRDFWNLLSTKYAVYYILQDGLSEIPNYQEALEIYMTSNFFFHKK